jgi:hypothetical protein
MTFFSGMPGALIPINRTHAPLTYHPPLLPAESAGTENQTR